MRQGRIIVLATLLAAFGCEKKQPDANKAVPAELRPTKASFDPSKLKAPALFANIPADTPYVIAAFEPVSLDYYAKIKQGFGPMIAQLIKSRKAVDEDGTPSVLDAVIDELGGKLDAKGLESLGLATQPRFALYGLGAAPAVMRIEIKDEAALKAAIERVATKGGKTLPPQETKEGKSYWRAVDGKVTLIVAILDQHLVVAFGPATAIDAKLGLILGLEKPAQSMADGKALIDLMSKHGFGPQLIGFVDTRKLAAQGFVLSDEPPPAGCAAAIDQLAAKVPRLVLGATEMSAKRISGGYVLELDPALLGEVAALRNEVPGLDAVMSNHPLVAFGGGVDLMKGATLLARAATAMREVGDACQIAGLSEGAGAAASTLSKPLPAPLTKITGGAMALHDLEVASGGLKKLDAFGMVTSSAPQELVDFTKTLVPLDQLGFKADGKLNKLTLPTSALPSDVFAGVGDKAIVGGTGAKGRALAEKALHGTPVGKSPFLVMSYDYGRFFQLQAQLAMMTGQASLVTDEMAKSIGAVFGRANFTVDATDKGVIMWFGLDLK